MTDVAFAPTWHGNRTPRRFLVLAVGIVLVILAFAAGPQLIIDHRDLNCPVGYGARLVGPAYWAVQCQANEGPATWPRSVPIARYVGLFFANASVRVFDADVLAGTVHGPALNVPIR